MKIYIIFQILVVVVLVAAAAAVLLYYANYLRFRNLYGSNKDYIKDRMRKSIRRIIPFLPKPGSGQYQKYEKLIIEAG